MNVCFLMTKPFQRERTDSRLKQSSYRSLWLTKEFIAFTYRSKGKRQLTESRMIQRQLATLKIPPQPGWQLTKTAILECNMTDWQTGGTSNQRAQHDWQTGGLTSQRLFCASPLIGLFLAIWLVTFLPQWLVLVFLSWGWERLGTLANFSFPKQEVCLLPSPSWIERINTVTRQCWPAEGTFEKVFHFVIEYQLLFEC